VRQVQSSFFGQFVNIAACGRCRGTGEMIEVACLKCRGEGRLVDSSTVSVDVPAGVAQDNYIPLRGLGDAGPNGGPAGDLQVLIEEKPHDLFTRDGADLWVECRSRCRTPRSAATIEIPTLDGPVTKKIPPARRPAWTCASAAPGCRACAAAARAT
jgi:molecular chaperone DnaJ